MRTSTLAAILSLALSASFNFICLGKSTVTKRTLHFPRQSIGKAYAINTNDSEALLTRGSIKGRFIGSACGTYSIAAEEKVYLELDPNAADNPDTLDGLGADTVYAMKVGFTDSSEKFLPAIGRLTGLHRLDLDDCIVSQSGLAQLSNDHSLERLTLESCELRGDCARGLQNCKNLHYLSLAGNHLKPPAVADIFKLPKLEYLVLARCALSNEAFKSASSLKQIKFLDLNSNAALNVTSLEYLKACPDLKTLRIQFTAIKARDLLKLQGIKLHTVDLHESTMSNSELKSLKSAFPECNFVLSKKEPKAEFKVLFGPTTR